MWGGSEARRRLDSVERIADAARESATKALAEIAAHTSACNVRQQSIDRQLDDIGKRFDALGRTLSWVNRQTILVLLTILGAILFEVAKSKGIL